MKHRRTFGVAALVAGVVVLDGGALLRAVEVSPAAGQQVYAAMAAETHRSQGYIGVEMRDLSEDKKVSATAPYFPPTIGLHSPHAFPFDPHPKPLFRTHSWQTRSHPQQNPRQIAQTHLDQRPL